MLNDPAIVSTHDLQSSPVSHWNTSSSSLSVPTAKQSSCTLYQGAHTNSVQAPMRTRQQIHDDLARVGIVSLKTAKLPQLQIWGSQLTIERARVEFLRVSSSWLKMLCLRSTSSARQTICSNCRSFQPSVVATINLNTRELKAMQPKIRCSPILECKQLYSLFVGCPTNAPVGFLHLSQAWIRNPLGRSLSNQLRVATSCQKQHKMNQTDSQQLYRVPSLENNLPPVEIPKSWEHQTGLNFVAILEQRSRALLVLWLVLPDAQKSLVWIWCNLAAMFACWD